MSEQTNIEMAIDDFAGAMKRRMLSKAKQGWRGWNVQGYPHRLLWNAADAAVNNNSESMIDCANFCMMAWRLNKKNEAPHES